MVNLAAERGMKTSNAAVSSDSREGDRVGANRNRPVHPGGRKGSESANKLDVGGTGISTLHEAAKKKDTEATREILQRGRERGTLIDLLSARDIRRRTALHIAAGSFSMSDPKYPTAFLQWMIFQMTDRAIPNFSCICLLDLEKT
jgi:hypothetical protein